MVRQIQNRDWVKSIKPHENNRSLFPAATAMAAAVTVHSGTNCELPMLLAVMGGRVDKEMGLSYIVVT